MASTVGAPRGSVRRTGKAASAGPASREARNAFVLAPLTRRVAGAAIDMALLMVVAGLMTSWLEGVTSGVTRVRIDATSGVRVVDASVSLPLWLPVALLVVLTALYTVPLMALWGRTLGGLLVGIRCVRADSGTVPGWSLSMRRWFALYGAAGVLGFLPVVGPFAWLLILVVGLSPLWDGSHRLRGYADYFGDDVVVMARSRASAQR